mmetsp:Transcript_36189/g.71242  ORF Transcript_36189/g.71242 Transcript_36189/m.71242 type:complete len:200 (+) Transcript_36189:408-1007(+)
MLYQPIQFHHVHLPGVPGHANQPYWLWCVPKPDQPLCVTPMGRYGTLVGMVEIAPFLHRSMGKQHLTSLTEMWVEATSLPSLRPRPPLFSMVMSAQRLKYSSDGLAIFVSPLSPWLWHRYSIAMARGNSPGFQIVVAASRCLPAAPFSDSPTNFVLRGPPSSISPWGRPLLCITFAPVSVGHHQMFVSFSLIAFHCHHG